MIHQPNIQNPSIFPAQNGERPIQYEHTQCDMHTITKVTQILDQMGKCGFAISRGMLEQVNLFNNADMKYKFINQFELPDNVDRAKLENDP